MASRPAHFRTAHAVTRNAFVQAAGGHRTAHAPAALAGFRSLHHGPHSAEDDHVGDRFNIFLARLCFRGIYFPMMRKSSWLRVLLENRRTIRRLLKEGLFRWARPR